MQMLLAAGAAAIALWFLSKKKQDAAKNEGGNSATTSTVAQASDGKSAVASKAEGATSSNKATPEVVENKSVSKAPLDVSEKKEVTVPTSAAPTPAEPARTVQEPSTTPVVDPSAAIPTTQEAPKEVATPSIAQPPSELAVSMSTPATTVSNTPASDSTPAQSEAPAPALPSEASAQAVPTEASAPTQPSENASTVPPSSNQAPASAQQSENVTSNTVAASQNSLLGTEGAPSAAPVETPVAPAQPTEVTEGKPKAKEPVSSVYLNLPKMEAGTESVSLAPTVEAQGKVATEVQAAVSTAPMTSGSQGISTNAQPTSDATPEKDVVTAKEMSDPITITPVETGREVTDVEPEVTNATPLST